VEPAQERLGLRVLVEVDPAMRQPVAGGEVAQPTRVTRVAGPDDRQPGALADEVPATNQERAHDHVADAGVARHQLTQPLDGHGQDLAGLGGRGGHERRLAGEQTELAEEAAGAVDGQDALLVGDRHLAVEDHGQVLQSVALLEQHVAGVNGR
jgi:hypothetical protein